ncbi:hypothetical protein [Rhodopirellula bahusiensis]|uniref:hypothetical protein n=1 Tax=Rhodopirellula bahusiensis TaxID=2014065 RepID=UPI003265921F
MSPAITDLLGEDRNDVLKHRCETIHSSRLHLPGPDFMERVVCGTDRNQGVLNNLVYLDADISIA